MPTGPRSTAVDFVAGHMKKNRDITMAELKKLGKKKGINVYPLIIGLARKQLGIKKKTTKKKTRRKKVTVRKAAGGLILTVICQHCIELYQFQHRNFDTTKHQGKAIKCFFA